MAEAITERDKLALDRSGDKPGGGLARLLGLLVMLLIIALGIFASDRFARNLEDSQRQARTAQLRELTATNQNSAAGALKVLEETLAALSAYGRSAQPFDANAFTGLANSALARNPALRAVLYAPLQTSQAAAPPTSDADILGTIGTTRTTGEAANAPAESPAGMFERNWLGALVPAAQRARYLPIIQVHLSKDADPSFAATLKGLQGLDVLSDAEWAASLSDPSKNLSISYRSLAKGNALILLPIYAADGSNGGTLGRVSLQGAILAEVEIARLLGAASGLKTGETVRASARVFDATDPSGLKLLFPSAKQSLETAAVAPQIATQKARDLQRLDFAALGRNWLVETEPLATFYQADDSNTPQLVRYGGIALSALAALLLLNLITRNARIEKLVGERGAALSDAYTQLRDSELMTMQSEKMSSLGQMVAGVAHEINTPLAFAASNVELLKERMEKVRETVALQDALLGQLKLWPNLDQAARNAWYHQALEQSGKIERLARKTLGSTGALVDESIEGLERVRDLVATLKDFSRVDRAAEDEVDLHKCIENTLKIGFNVVKHKAELVREFSDLPRVRCNPSQINQVLLNLITNAAQAMKDFGQIRLSTRHLGDFVEIDIADNGVGMSAATMKKIFEPFYTTKASGEGTGLGLAICDKIIKAHGGSISVQSAEGTGTTFTLRLPVRGPAQADA